MAEETTKKKRIGRPPGSKNKSKASERLNQPKQWNGCRCMCCGRMFNERKNNFSKTKSYWFKGNQNYLPWCKNCMNEMFEYYMKHYDGNCSKALERLSMMFDTYFSETLVEYSNNAPGQSIINTYVGRLNMSQFKDKTYDDVILEKESKEIADAIAEGVPPKGTKITPRMIKFWGPDLNENDYLFLDEHYKNLTTRLECKTATQEILFKRIAKAELNCENADATGDTKKIKEANDNLQNLMASANIKPNQTNDNSLAESNTFGMLIQKWEETGPITEPDPEWKDVDGIGKYFRVWVLGTLLNMFGLKNPYKEEYDKEIALYTAHKPEYQDDDDSSESIRDKIFGPESTSLVDGK